MAENIYILSTCDEWASRDSMRIVGVTSDETMLHAMLAAKIKFGDMSYGGLEGVQAVKLFQQDFQKGEVDCTKLGYGFVQSYTDMQIAEPLSMAVFPEAGAAYEELTGAKVKAELEKLGLDHRSLTYSVVEVRTDFGYECFLVPGICDRDGLESSDQFQEMMEDTTETEVNASVYSYSVGTGESVYPDENKLAIIEKYADELDKEYGVDAIQSDFISFFFEAEQEY